MAITDGHGLPIGFHLASASPHETKLVEATLDNVYCCQIPSKIICDRAYGSDPLDNRIKAKYEIDIVAPHKDGRRKKPTQDGRSLRRYARRWKVERLFAWLQNYRRLTTRWEHYLHNFQGFLELAAVLILIRFGL